MDLRSALLKSTNLNPVDHLEHLTSKVNWVNFEINSVLPSLLLVFVEKVLTCLFTPPLGNFQSQWSRVLRSGGPNHSKSLCALVFFPLFQLTSKTLRPLLILGFRAGALRHPAGDLLSDIWRAR